MPPDTHKSINETNRFEAFYNHASMSIVVVNSKNLIQLANPFALRLFGYSLEEIVDKPIELLIPKRYHTKHVNHRDNYVKEPKDRPMGVGFDLFAIKKDGSEFPVEVSLGNYQTEDDKHFIAFISDITIRKKAEASIEKMNEELEAAVELRTKVLNKTLQKLELANVNLDEVFSYQKAILDNAGAMIIATNKDGLIKLFNPEASITIGYMDSEVINKETPLLFHDKTEIIQRRKNLLNEFGVHLSDDFSVLVEKARRGIHEEEQYTYIRRNKTSFPVSLTITTIKDNSEEIIGFMGIAIDISERLKAEEELRKSLDKEKELSSLKTRFVTMASHEFRTPLSTILSSSYLIEKYTTTEEQAKRERHLHRIISSVNMLTDILNDFLSVGKIEEGKIQVRPSTFNIKKEIDSILEEIKNNLKNDQMINYEHNGDTGVVMDLSLLKHIIMNLISNASKFSPEASLIAVNTFCTQEYIKLSVKDQGMGISKEDQKHLMERFFRGTNAGNIQGTGLGLHIISKYAELMNGFVECKSVLEKGTEFELTFNIKAN